MFVQNTEEERGDSLGREIELIIMEVYPDERFMLSTAVHEAHPYMTALVRLICALSH